jgi:hypothetical protein
MRKILAAVLFAVLPGLALSHYYFLRPVPNPTSTTTTTTGTATAPVVTTQWRCVTAAGATVLNGGPFTTKAAAEAPCGVAVAAAAPSATPTHFLEESVITTTNVPTQTTVRTRRDEVYGGNTIRIADAHAQFIGMQRGGTGPFPAAETFTEMWCVSDQDIAKVDWHGTYPMVCATRPTTTSTATCTTAANCTTALAVDGAQVTVSNSGFTGNVNITGDDTDFVVGSGVTIAGTIIFGDNCPTGTMTRGRIRGGTANTGATTGAGHNGGLVGEIRALSCTTHITVDGISSNTEGNLEADRSCVRTENAEPVTWVWTRCHSGAAGGYTSGNTIFNHVSMLTATSTSASTDANGWCIRAYGATAILNSDLRGHSHTCIRSHNDSADDAYLAVISSIVMNDGEARVIQAFPCSSCGGAVNDGSGIGDGFVDEDNDYYAYAASGCSVSAIYPIDTPSSRVTDSRFHSAGNISYTQTVIDNAQAAAPTGTHTDSGLTFDTWSVMPAWGGAGDPSGIAKQPGEVTATTGRGGASCTFSGI